MYVYFDSTGTIKEIVNDDKIRQASDNANRLYFYFESSTAYTSISLILRYPDKTNSSTYPLLNSLINNSETLYFPETDKDLNYFVEGKQYTMYYYDLTSTDLAQSGTCLATVTCYTNSTAVVNGLLTFNVEESVILSSTELTQSDLTYMLEQIASNNTVFVYGSGITSTLGSSQDEDDPTTLGDRSVELGYGAKASGSYSNAIGQQAQATGNSANAIGSTARATGYGATAIGEGIIVSGDNSCGIGNTATAGGDYASAMGDTARATGNYSVAIGNTATAIGNKSVSIGNENNYASGVSSVAIGTNAYADGEDSIAIGTVATSTGASNIGIGDNVNVQGIQSIGIGNTATASSGYDVAIGYNADASGTSSIAIGREAVANNNYTIAVGYNSTASRYGAVAIGSATANNLHSNAVGFGAVSSSAHSTQLGEGTNSQANTLQFGNIVIADGSNNELEIDITSSVDTSTYVMTLNLVGKYYDSGTSTYTTKTISTTSIDLPLESTIVNGSYDNANKKLILTLQSGNTIEIGLGDLISGLQTQSRYLDGITSACENSSYTGFLYRNASDEIEIRAVNPSSVYVDTSVPNAITSSISSHPISSTTLGSGAIELGADTEASSSRALAIGYSAKATSSYALAIGNGAIASASDGLAIGDGAIASDSYALAIGNAEAKGGHSLAIGSEAIANFSSGDNGVAIGYQADARYDNTIAIGNDATTYDDTSTAIGYKAVTSAENSVQLGQGTNNTANSLQFMTTPVVVSGNIAIKTGGTTGQVLAKNSDNDYDYAWVDQSGGYTDGYRFISYINTNVLPAADSGDVYESSSASPLVFNIGGRLEIVQGDAFNDGDYVYFNNTISDADMLTWMQGLTYDENGVCDLIFGVDENENTIPFLSANYADMTGEGDYVYALGVYTAENDGIVWIDNGAPLGMTNGWQQLTTDGGLLLSYPNGEQSVIITSTSNEDNWNGIIVKGTLPQTLTLNKGDWLCWNGIAWQKVDNQEYASTTYVDNIVGDINTILSSLVTP